VIFDDLRVFAATSDLAGLYCTKLLADLGADVVQWEPSGGHALRGDGLFAYLTTSQRSITGEPSRWIETADIVIRNDPMPRDFPVVDARALVTVDLSALGHGGPDDALNAAGMTEEVLQARSGALSGHGHMGQTPLTIGGRLGEYVTGAFGALSAITAWRRARETGAAEFLDIAKLEAMHLTMLTLPTLMARFPGGNGQTFRFVMIPGNEPTGDGSYVGITTVTSAQWKALLGAMGREDLVTDTELHTMIGRFLRAGEVNRLLHDFTEAHTAEELDTICYAARVPVAVVGNGELLPRFAHLAEREVFVRQPGAAFSRPRAPWRFHGLDDRVLTPAPRVGEHVDHRPWLATDRPARASTAWSSTPRLPPPLAGIRVLDFTAFWAGPFATAWLAAMGAEVIKVESVQRPDGIRFSGMVRSHQEPRYYEMSALFHAVNLNKRGITLDLTRPEGVEIAKQLAARVDVVCENFTPRVMEDFGLDWEALRSVNGRLVMLRLPAFGLTGPWRDRPGFAQTMEQLTGMAWVTGYEGGPPIIAGGVVDPAVGAHAALGVLAGLAHRDATGCGILVEVPMVDVAVGMTAEQVIRHQTTGEVLGRRGEGGVYRCAGNDEWIAVDGASDPLDAASRAAWCATRTKEDAQAELLASGVVALAMIPGHATLDDRQLQARGYYEPLTHPDVGEHFFPGFPVRFDRGPDRFWHTAAPTLGRDTHTVLRDELGLDDGALERLHADLIIGTEPLTSG